MTDLRDRVLQALAHEEAPGTGTDVIGAGLIRALSVTDGVVSFVLETEGPVPEGLRARIEARVGAVDGVSGVACYLSEGGAQAGAAAPGEGPKPVRGVARTVLIGSGKGGVGKSTVTANLALALADQGLRVGLLDADIYGPSVPQMMGTQGRPVSYDGTLIPIAAHGIKLMSVGLMLAREEALVWRGPILANTLAQMLHEVRWEPLDILLIDLPPGTGDVQITLAQEARIDGAVVVTTPQQVALNDARRSIDLLRRTDVPILGLVENMATHICTGCGREEAIFGTGGAADEARAQGIPLLGSLPLEPLVCTAADAGVPAVRSAPDSVSARRFHEIATALRDALAPT